MLSETLLFFITNVEEIRLKRKRLVGNNLYHSELFTKLDLYIKTRRLEKSWQFSIKSNINMNSCSVTFVVSIAFCIVISLILTDTCRLKSAAYIKIYLSMYLHDFNIQYLVGRGIKFWFSNMFLLEKLLIKCNIKIHCFFQWEKRMRGIFHTKFAFEFKPDIPDKTKISILNQKVWTITKYFQCFHWLN